MPRYLADTSAWHRSGAPRIAAWWDEALQTNEIATCTPVMLELLYSARGPADYSALAIQLARLPQLPLDASAVTRSERSQAALARRSQHRGPRPIDLLVAGVAEAHGATLLHYDRHFDAIARVTGQPCEWVARRGSLD